MIVKDLVFPLIGGLGFFFFGMQLMTEGLKNVAGDNLKKILHMATRIPLVGIIVGAVVTCLIQSSSATTVMVVGFVNAGLLVLKQAISVIIGANIGTTFTAWLVSSMSVFKVTDYALPVIGIGFGLNAFGKSKNVKFWGQILMGFGLLFMGLDFMKEAFMPLRESPHVIELFARFGKNPILGILVGLVITMLIQSSSATIAIVQLMAFNGIIGLPAAITLMLGGDIGTTITAQLAAIGTNLGARRAAMSHTLFNFIGVGYMMIFVYTGWFVKFVDFIVPGELTAISIMVHIAVANSIFKFGNAIIFLPLIGTLEKACVFLVPKKSGAVEAGPQYLEPHLINTPSIALEQAQKEAVYMLKVASESVSTAVDGFFTGSRSKLGRVSELEEAVDNLQSAITQYLIDLSQVNLTQSQSEELPVLIHIVNDIERIGDHSENIVEFAERRAEKKLSFSKEAIEELNLVWGELHGMMNETIVALDKSDLSIASKILIREDHMNQFQINLKNLMFLVLIKEHVI